MQTGRVWLWRYPGAARHFPGWHMTADAAGAASLCDLLDAFERQVGPSFRTVANQRPFAADSVPCRTIDTPPRMRLRACVLRYPR